MPLTELPYTIQNPLVDADDIRQEAMIFEWQNPGKRANKQFIAKRLSVQSPALIFHGDISYAPIIEPYQDPRETVQRIVEWSRQQSLSIQNQIQLFLEDGSEKALQETLEVLRNEGLITSTEHVERRPSFTGALLGLIEKHTRAMHKTEFYEWAQREHAAKRPDATVRQALRTLVKQGKIIDVGNGYYQRKGE